MKIERAVEILDPEHREHYDDLEEVNEACRMGMAALRIAKEIAVDNDLPYDLREAAELMERGVYLPGHRGAMRRAAELLERMNLLCAESRHGGNAKVMPGGNVVMFDNSRRNGPPEDD